jgi:Kinesin motor domain
MYPRGRRLILLYDACGLSHDLVSRCSSTNSLLSLSRVIQSLSLPASKRPPHINYRDSKLTRILQPHLSGNACVALLCCVSPSKACVDETRSTLKFASAARRVETSPVVNSFVDHATLIQNLESELSETKQALRTLQCYVDTSHRRLRKGVVEGSVVSGVGSVYTEDDWDPFTLGDDDDEKLQGGGHGGRARATSAAANFAASSDDWMVGVGNGSGSCASSSSLHPIQEVLVLSTLMECTGDAPLDSAAAARHLATTSTTSTSRSSEVLAALTRRLESSLHDAELRTSFLEEKLSATDKLVDTLFRDLEEARRSNRELRDQLAYWSAQDPPLALPTHEEENHEGDEDTCRPDVVDRETVRLIKTAFYSATAFYATGQTELFLATVMFMWLSLEGCT